MAIAMANGPRQGLSTGRLPRLLPILATGLESVQVQDPATGLGPDDDVVQPPDAAHGKFRDGFGEVAALGELVDPGARRRARG